MFTEENKQNVDRYLEKHKGIDTVLIRDIQADINVERVKAKGEKPDPFLKRRREYFRFIAKKEGFFSKPKNVIKDDIAMIAYLKSKRPA